MTQCSKNHTKAYSLQYKPSRVVDGTQCFLCKYSRSVIIIPKLTELLNIRKTCVHQTEQNIVVTHVQSKTVHTHTCAHISYTDSLFVFTSNPSLCTHATFCPFTDCFLGLGLGLRCDISFSWVCSQNGFSHYKWITGTDIGVTVLSAKMTSINMQQTRLN